MTSYTSRRSVLKSTGAFLLGAATPSGLCATTSHPGRRIPGRRIEVAQFHMNMLVKLTAYVDDPEHGYHILRKAFQQIRRYVGVFSRFDKRSELSRLSARAGQGPVRVSNELFCVLSTAHQMAEQSHGAFDPTAGAITHVWRTARYQGTPPTAADIDRASGSCGYQNMILDAVERTVALLQSDMRLDLGGIAKGYIGDLAIRYLHDHGAPCAAFEAGGDIVVGDAPPHSDGWKIDALGATEPLVLHNRAISISGDKHQHLDYQGRRYSHVVDPRSGQALIRHEPSICQASTGLTADVKATLRSIV